VEVYDGDQLLDTVTVNQQIDGGQWNVLGTYSFRKKAMVKILSSENDLVVADALRFNPVSEIVIDNRDASASSTGTWKVSTSKDYYGNESLYSLEEGSSYAFESSALGVFEISLWWTAYSNRSDNVSVGIFDGDELLDTVIVNQQFDGGQWNVLGDYTFTAKAIVKVLSSGNGITVADAVKFMPIPDIVIDNSDADVSSTGTWNVSTADGFHGSESIFSVEDDASYTFEALAFGQRDISLWWTAYSNRSDNVNVEIYDGDELLDTITVNQQVNGSKWNVLGTYFFSEKAKVQVLSSGGDVTVVDAVKFSSASNIITDNSGAGAIATGVWKVSSAEGFYGTESLYTFEDNASYTFETLAFGTKEVSLWWTASSNRSDNVSVGIFDGDELLDTVAVNQQINGGRWNVLGYYTFTGIATIKILSSDGGAVIADAVKFTPLQPFV
jgi:hypothetical protein